MAGQCKILCARPGVINVPLSPFSSWMVRNVAVGIPATAKPQEICTGLGQKPSSTVWEIGSICGIPKRACGFSQPYLQFSVGGIIASCRVFADM